MRVCSTCGVAHYCSAECESEDKCRHERVCPLLRASASVRDDAQRAALSGEEINEALTLLACVAHAAALRAVDPTTFEQLWSLHAEGVQLSKTEELSIADSLHLLGPCFPAPL